MCVWGPPAPAPLATAPASPTAVPGGAAEYRPAEDAARARAQAKQVKELLAAFAGGRGRDPHWGQRFWTSIHSLKMSGQLGPDLEKLLVGYGYVGEKTISPPRFEELAAHLDRFGAEAALAAGPGSWPGLLLPGA